MAGPQTVWQSLADKVGSLAPSSFQAPPWLVDEGQRRLVLLLNHVLQQEKAAQERLSKKKGSVAHVRYGLFAINFVVTPAGLLDLADPQAAPDLVLTLPTEQPLQTLRTLLAGKPPAMTIEGDVQLAGEVAWLAENVRWDAEEDLARLMGDAPAHALCQGARQLVAGLRKFLARQK